MAELQGRIAAHARPGRDVALDDLIGARAHLEQSMVVAAHLLAILQGAWTARTSSSPQPPRDQAADDRRDRGRRRGPRSAGRGRLPA